ncbi:MAG: hypothetical protein QXK12_08665 [Candidatus Nezhaarchaeales archaeon]
MVPIKRYWKNILGLLLSVFLLIGSLYQLEIVYIGVYEHWPRFDFPFYIYSCSLPLARDIFYLGIVLSWILLFVSLWWWP